MHKRNATLSQNAVLTLCLKRLQTVQERFSSAFHTKKVAIWQILRSGEYSLQVNSIFASASASLPTQSWLAIPGWLQKDQVAASNTRALRQVPITDIPGCNRGKKSCLVGGNMKITLCRASEFWQITASGGPYQAIDCFHLDRA